MSTNKTKAVQRSLEHLRRMGWQAAIVEKWIPPRGEMKFGVRIDVWGFGDILACIHPREYFPKGAMKRTTAHSPAIALIQTFPMARWKDHLEKLSALPELQIWKRSGGLVFIHGWALRPKDGIRGAKKIWTLQEQSI